MTAINLFHYPFCPADSIGDGTHRGWNPCPAVVLRQRTCCEDTGGDHQHSLAPFVHFGSVALSLYIRLYFENMWMLALGVEGPRYQSGTPKRFLRGHKGSLHL